MKTLNISIFSILLTATLVVSGFFIFINKVQADTFYVCPEISGECTHDSIQSAITAANEEGGDIINIASGSYNETLNLGEKALTIEGSARDDVIIDASSFTGHAIQSFGDSTIIRNLTLIGSDNYGFKVSHVDDIILENIKVEDSYRTGIDLNTVNNAVLSNIEIINTEWGFGLMILDSNNVVVTDITTNNNVWGGVSVQTKDAVSDSINFSGNFDVQENMPFLIEQDPDAENKYYEITNVQIPDKFSYIVYDFREGDDNYKQWYYFETLDDSETVAQLFSEESDYSDIIIYDIAEDNYYVIEGMLIQDAINAASEGDTINVAAGIYEEAIKIMDKSLTLLGAQAGVPIVDSERAGEESIIRGKVDWRDRPSTYCLVRIQNSDVVVNGFSIENAKQWNIAIQGSSIRSEGISNVVVSYNYIVGDSVYGKDGIFRDSAAADVTITHNYIASNPWRGILTNGGATTITDNTFYGNGKGIDFTGIDPYSVYFPDYAEPKYPTLISGNTFTNDSTSITLRLDKGHQSIMVTDNDITGASSVAIRTWNTYDEDIVNPAIHYNNISNNEFGINNQVTDINLNATYNWWESVNGPTHASNPGVNGDAVSDNVDFKPWYANSEMTSLKAPTITDPVTGDTVLEFEQSIDIISNDIIVSMPAGITITATASWEGIINAPSIESKVLDTPPRESGYNTTVDTIIEIGYSNIKLVFDKAVKILIPNQAGKRVGYVRPDEDFQEITNVCSNDIQPTDDSFLPPEGDCKTDVDNDLVVWTKHFTQFIVYSYSPIIVGPTFRAEILPEEEPSPLSEEAQKIDANKDDKIDDLDLKELFANWGSTILDNIADFNKDSKVDVFDFNLLMVHWTE